LLPQLMAIAIAGLAAESAAAVPRLLCYPVMPGETVTSIAIRLTRDPHRWRRSDFQILDPAAGRLVGKSDYGRVRAGWQACLVQPAFERAGAGLQPVGTMHLWLLILLCSAGMIVWLAVDASLAKMKATSRALEQFGAAFVREFERPLIDERSARPVIRAELALSPDRRTLEVLLAPAEGRRYPNLADHRTNVEYDVMRVVSLLNDRRFICGPLRERGSWVAVPFRLKPDLQKEGGA
jgi:hypothetical protein